MASGQKIGKLTRILARSLAVLLGIILLLLIIAYVLLQTSWGNQQLRKIATAYLEKTLKTDVTINRLHLKGLSGISIYGVRILDQQHQPLFSADSLELSLDILGLLNKKVDVSSIAVSGLDADLHRPGPGKPFNYDFVIQAFVSPEDTPVDTAASPWVISLGDVSLRRIRFKYDDRATDNRYNISFRSFHTNLASSDAMRMKFATSDTYLDSLKADIRLSPIPDSNVTTNEAVQTFLAFSGNNIRITNTSLDLENPSDSLSLHTRIPFLELLNVAYDQKKSNVAIRSIVLDQHSTTLAYRSEASSNTGGTASSAFALSIDTISVVNNNISARNTASGKTYRDRFDPNNIQLQELQLQAAEIQYAGSSFQGRISHLSFRDQNGFTAKNISGRAFYSDTALYVNGLNLQTNRNTINGSLQMHYPSMATIMDKPALTRVNLDVDNASLAMDEITYFAPSLAANEYVKNLKGRKVTARLKANGTLDDLNIASYDIRTGNTKFAGSARVLHPTDPKTAAVNASFATVSSTKQELRSLLPENLIADSIWDYVPDRFNISGKLSASQQRIAPDLTISTSSGDLVARGYINNPSDKRNAAYDMFLRGNSIALGKILKDTSLGNLSMQLSAKGRGYDPATMKAAMRGQLYQLDYQGYRYHDLAFDGALDHNKASANISSSDPNIDLSGTASFIIGKRPSAIFADIDIRNLDLDTLGLASNGLALKGKINADVPKVDSGHIEGKASIDGLALRYNNKNYWLDTLRANAVLIGDTQYISLRSALADADLKGHFTLEQLPANLKVIADNYLLTTGATEPFTAPMFADLKVDVHIADSIASLVPGLKSLSPFAIRAMMDTRNNEILMGTKIPSIDYAGYKMENIVAGIYKDSTRKQDSTLAIAFSTDRIRSQSLNLGNTLFGGTARKGVLNGGFIVMGNDRKRIAYGLPFIFVNDPLRPYLQLTDTLILNRTRWQVSTDNRVYLDMKDIRGSRLRIYNKEQAFTLGSDSSSSNGYPLTASINKFKLESIAGIMNKDSLFASGEINGNFRLDEVTPLRFNTDISIDSLAILGSAVGDLKTNVTSDHTGLINANVSLTGAGNQASVIGTYRNETSDINVKVDLAPLALRSLRPLAGEYVDSLRGGVNGSLVITGKTNDPRINGSISLDSSFFILRQTGAPISTSSARLDFNGRQIAFNGMQIADSAGNPANITGTVSVEDLSEVNYDLRLRTQKFLVAGHRRHPDQQISGPLNVATDLTIKGTQTEAAINGSINVKDSSVLNYVVSRDESVGNRQGLIEFFDPSKPVIPDTLEINARTVPAAFKLNLNTYLNITPSSTVVIVLDELTGDQLKVKGTANFNFGIDPSGRTSLVGNYQVDSGTYDLSIAGLIRKEFSVQKGSNITWTGDILQGNMDLHAVYRVKTDASELVQDVRSTPGISKQNFNFLVYMDLKGALLKPDISFRLDMLETERTAFDGIVYSRLKQVNNVESELNKQVMGLLALNSFIAENPFSAVGGSGGSFETQAFSTAGNLLTQELNDFVGNAIKDVDIDIGLDIRDDYTTGQAVRKSDLKVGLAKSFNNNRLNVYVGNTFALENQNQQQDLLSGLAGDVSLEYLLTSDGRYRLRGYRRTKNDITFNGTVVETGASFVVVLEFNKLKNVLKKRSKRNKENIEP